MSNINHDSKQLGMKSLLEMSEQHVKKINGVLQTSSVRSVNMIGLLPGALFITHLMHT